MIDYSFPVEELEYFLLVMTRISCFVFVAPFFSIGSVPSRVKIGFSFFLSILVYYTTCRYLYAILNEILTRTSFCFYQSQGEAMNVDEKILEIVNEAKKQARQADQGDGLPVLLLCLHEIISKSET